MNQNRMESEELKGINSAQIMMVDDDIITMEVVQTFLEEAGYENFTLVQDPKKALPILESASVDILLLDLVMPEVSGFDVLRKVRNHEKLQHLPVIILTGSSDHESKLKALDLGATDFLAKPVDPSELVLRVRNTLSAKAYQDQLAFYDPVTKLPNRKLFLDQFDWALKRANRYNYKLSLLSIAIDNFTMVNTNLGFHGADELLRQLSNRISQMIRDVDVLGQLPVEDDATGLYRLEGAALTLLLDRVQDVEDSAIIAERLVTGLRLPFNIEGEDIFITVSVGISSYPEEGSNLKILIELASNARAHAQSTGGDSFKFSSKEIKELYEKRFAMEGQLRKALAKEELVLYYQPKVDLQTGLITGTEALIRWVNPEIGFVSPIDFIPIAEETGLIIPIGEWILRTAFSQLRKWQGAGKTELTMNVNLSIKQFNDPDFLHTIERVIHETDIDPKNFTLEITESLLMDKIEETLDKLKHLKSLGFNLSIDDFGTGYSSFSYLCQLPVDELKIDRAFIMNLPEDSSSSAVVTSIIYLSEKLGLKTVAEGVETAEQLSFLRETSCSTYQGFFFSRPLPSTEFSQLLFSVKE